jgi:hypothetical protein
LTGPRIVGVHRIIADEPVHLLEIDLRDLDGQLDFSSVTQTLEGKDSSFWQVPYDEHHLPGRPGRWYFFFHYLDLTRPLSSNLGDLPLPAESAVPDHLRLVEYDAP